MTEPLFNSDPYTMYGNLESFLRKDKKMKVSLIIETENNEEYDDTIEQQVSEVMKGHPYVAFGVEHTTKPEDEEDNQE